MLLLNVLLAIAWAALTGQFGVIDLLFGFVLGYLMLWPARYQLGGERYFRKTGVVIRFAFYFIWELIKANYQVARTVLFTPKDRLHPGIIGVPLDIKSDAEITMLANLITLTPGTLSLDVSQDCTVLFVHSIEVDDPEAFRSATKQGFERAVREVFD
jgi:multicomponent Na+:H+ antiporter subunit E